MPYAPTPPPQPLSLQLFLDFPVFSQFFFFLEWLLIFFVCTTNNLAESQYLIDPPALKKIKMPTPSRCVPPRIVYLFVCLIEASFKILKEELAG